MGGDKDKEACEDEAVEGLDFILESYGRVEGVAEKVDCVFPLRNLEMRRKGRDCISFQIS